MGKDSLIKSTTKKGGTKKDKKPSKKKTAAKASGAQHQKEAPVKPKAGKKAEPAVTLQDLLFKQFSKSEPPSDSLPPALDLSGMTAPPFITSTDPQEVKRIRGLLEQRFSMEEIAAAAKEPEPVKRVLPVAPAAPRRPVSMEELLFRQFSTPRTFDEPPPAGQDLSQMTAPPLIASTDPQEVERLQSLLDRRFSMEAIIAAAQEPVAPAPPVVEAAPPAQAVEPVQAETPVQVPVQVEAAPSASTVPEPSQEPVPAQAPEPQVIDTPAPEAPPAEVAAPVMPESQAPVASAPAAAPAAEPPKVMASPAPATPQPAGTATPPKEEPPFQTPPSTPEPLTIDSGWRSFKLGIGLVAAVFLLIMWGSFSNSGKYFVMPKKGAIEIWRGTFSPTGKEFLAVLHGVEPASTLKDAYRREEISPILSNYYIGKADALLDVSGLPDYQSIGEYLQRAQAYASTDELRAAVQTRMLNIQRLSLMYKAEIDISKGTIASLQSAAETLKEVQRLTTEPSQLEALNQKIDSVNASLAELTEQGSPAESGHAAPEK